MAYVTGDLGKRIQELMDESNSCYDLQKYDEAIQLLIDAWNELPGEKFQYDESYLIVWGILDIAVYIKDIDIMNQWVDKIFYADPERPDIGEREMWAGKVAYENGDMDNALEYFKVANKKSTGRCFGIKDEKYKKYLKKNLNR